MDFQNAQAELAAHIDSVIASSNLNGLGAKLLDYWYAVQPETLSSWSPPAQHNWVCNAYAVKYGDLRAAPGALALAACDLLLELAQGFRPGVLVWDQAQGESWAAGIYYVRALAESSPPPPGWSFPSFALAQQPGSALDAPSFSVVRSDQRGSTRVRAADLMAQLRAGGRVFPPRPALDGCAADDDSPVCSGTWDTLANKAGGAALVQKVARKGDRLFKQKTKPIQFRNNASSSLKICLFEKDDKFCAVPVGGLHGPCVVTLDANQRVFLRPPGSADQFLLKVLAPGLIDKPLYYADVQRGACIQLRSHDCSPEK
mmetsp:Transcript_106575/g.301490  ORF Transcript_106575/g.301490 Transcript_106575/m.301490 type:complete len:315 (-) Transcript_106575:44-988(-)